MPALQIRPATPSDAPAVVALIHELAAAGGETSPLDEAYARQYLTDERCPVLLAEDSGGVIGLLSYIVRPDLYHAAPTAQINELVVGAAYRGQGLGRRMVEYLLKELQAAGCAEVSVTTMPDNAGAIRFYHSLGLVDEAVYLEKHFA